MRLTGVQAKGPSVTRLAALPSTRSPTPFHNVPCVSYRGSHIISIRRAVYHFRNMSQRGGKKAKGTHDASAAVRMRDLRAPMRNSAESPGRHTAPAPRRRDGYSEPRPADVIPDLRARLMIDAVSPLIGEGLHLYGDDLVTHSRLRRGLRNRCRSSSIQPREGCSIKQSRFRVKRSCIKPSTIGEQLCRPSA